MTEKQKKTLYRIIVAGILFIGLFIAEHNGTLEQLPSPWIAFFLCFIPYLIIGHDVIQKAVRNIKNGQVFDENFLMMIATFGAFVVQEYIEAVAVMLFYQVGELFQSYAVGKSRQSISDLMNICPEYANLEVDGELDKVDPDDVEVDSVIVIKPGEKVPLDGIVLDGDSFLDTSALTGESVPRKISVGDDIISGCINGSGRLRVRVTKEFDDSTVAKILELVENATSKKAKVENFITRFAKYYTPFVTVAAVILAIVPPLLFQENWMIWLERACTFLVISCPCALVISVPMGFFGGIGAASKEGVLVKGSNYLELLADMDTIVFDKTGTLTNGVFEVTEVFSTHYNKEELLMYAGMVEKFSNHPIAESIIKAQEAVSVEQKQFQVCQGELASDRNESFNLQDTIEIKKSANIENPSAKVEYSVSDVEELSGHGVRGVVSMMQVHTKEDVQVHQDKLGREAHCETCDKFLGDFHHTEDKLDKLANRDGAFDRQDKNAKIATSNQLEIEGYPVQKKEILVGNEKLMKKFGIAYEKYEGNGTVVYVAIDGVFAGSIVISDTIKDGVKEAISDLKKAGVSKTVMLTGDRKDTALAVAKKIGIDKVHYELLPSDKVAQVEEILPKNTTKKKLAFVGDGINDAPVLARADIGFAMGSLGSDAAIEAADIVIMDDDIQKIAKVIRISRKTMAIVKENIVFALGVKGLILLLGAMGYASMWMAVFADVGVAVIAILNSMRTLKKQR